MGDPPRDRYPLVIIVCDMRVIDDQYSELGTNQVVGNAIMYYKL